MSNYKYKLKVRDYDLYGLDEEDGITYYDYYPFEEIHSLVVKQSLDCDLYKHESGEWKEIENFKA